MSQVKKYNFTQVIAATLLQTSFSFKEVNKENKKN